MLRANGCDYVVVRQPPVDLGVLAATVRGQDVGSFASAVVRAIAAWHLEADRFVGMPVIGALGHVAGRVLGASSRVDGSMALLIELDEAYTSAEVGVGKLAALTLSYYWTFAGEPEGKPRVTGVDATLCHASPTSVLAYVPSTRTLDRLASERALDTMAALHGFKTGLGLEDYVALTDKLASALLTSFRTDSTRPPKVVPYDYRRASRYSSRSAM